MFRSKQKISPTIQEHSRTSLESLTCNSPPDREHGPHVIAAELINMGANPPSRPRSPPVFFDTAMTPKKRSRTGSSNPPTVAPIPKSQKPPGELLSTEEKRANHIASVRPRPSLARVSVDNRNKNVVKRFERDLIDLQRLCPDYQRIKGGVRR